VHYLTHFRGFTDKRSGLIRHIRNEMAIHLKIPSVPQGQDKEGVRNWREENAATWTRAVGRVREGRLYWRKITLVSQTIYDRFTKNANFTGEMPAVFEAWVMVVLAVSFLNPSAKCGEGSCGGAQLRRASELVLRQRNLLGDAEAAEGNAAEAGGADNNKRRRR
jgi:hypothetical protein